ncbi:hypothetical protein EJ04DRAFT_516050 [Polyplosphaeria fusca]|uniref:Uncharacterized protein n=1 Tax=Polyplosphaeria fusca TaxID=682080 RepID=A0A9P4QPX1_9PLEO|nr:hypothetical protein EJ04DRAFT_516050 [Polyplosphaeria fusca]
MSHQHVQRCNQHTKAQNTSICEPNTISTPLITDAHNITSISHTTRKRTSPFVQTFPFIHAYP